jgi:hypothetical protein
MLQNNFYLGLAITLLFLTILFTWFFAFAFKKDLLMKILCFPLLVLTIPILSYLFVFNSYDKITTLNYCQPNWKFSDTIFYDIDFNKCSSVNIVSRINIKINNWLQDEIRKFGNEKYNSAVLLHNFGDIYLEKTIPEWMHFDCKWCVSWEQIISKNTYWENNGDDNDRAAIILTREKYDANNSTLFWSWTILKIFRKDNPEKYFFMIYFSPGKSDNIK